MISYHIKDIMIGQTLESMLSIYRHYRHAWSVAHHHMSTHQSVTTEKKKQQITQMQWQNHTANGLRVDWAGLILSHREKKDDLLPSKNIWDETGHPSRLLQGCMDGARPEWSWVEGVTHARRDCGRLDKWRLRGDRLSCKTYLVVHSFIFIFLEII